MQHIIRIDSTRPSTAIVRRILHTHTFQNHSETDGFWMLFNFLRFFNQRWFLINFGTPLEVDFYHFVLLLFRGLRSFVLSVSFDVYLLVGLCEEMAPGSVVICAENSMSAIVFVRFHSSRCLVNWMISNRLWDAFLVAFWVYWIHFCWFVFGLGSRSENKWFSRGSLEGPRLREPGQVRVKGSSVGPLPANHRWQTCYSLTADTRTSRLTIADRRNA